MQRNNGNIGASSLDGDAIPTDVLKSIVGGGRAETQHDVTPDAAVALTAGAPVMDTDLLPASTTFPEQAKAKAETGHDKAAVGEKVVATKANVDLGTNVPNNWVGVNATDSFTRPIGKVIDKATELFKTGKIEVLKIKVEDHRNG